MSDLGGARTLDPMIKSHLLYQLSYEVFSLLRICRQLYVVTSEMRVQRYNNYFLAQTFELFFQEKSIEIVQFRWSCAFESD